MYHSSNDHRRREEADRLQSLPESTPLTVWCLDEQCRVTELPMPVFARSYEHDTWQYTNRIGTSLTIVQVHTTGQLNTLLEYWPVYSKGKILNVGRLGSYILFEPQLSPPGECYRHVGYHANCTRHQCAAAITELAAKLGYAYNDPRYGARLVRELFNIESTHVRALVVDTQSFRMIRPRNSGVVPYLIFRFHSESVRAPEPLYCLCQKIRSDRRRRDGPAWQFIKVATRAEIVDFVRVIGGFECECNGDGGTSASPVRHEHSETADSKTADPECMTDSGTDDEDATGVDDTQGSGHGHRGACPCERRLECVVDTYVLPEAMKPVAKDFHADLPFDLGAPLDAVLASVEEDIMGARNKNKGVQHIRQVYRATGLPIDQFMALLADSIKASVDMARRFPELVQTKMYIDDVRPRIWHEFLMLVEVNWNGRSHKLALAVIEDKLNGDKYDNRNSLVFDEGGNQVFGYAPRKVLSPFITQMNVFGSDAKACDYWFRNFVDNHRRPDLGAIVERVVKQDKRANHLAVGDLWALGMDDPRTSFFRFHEKWERDIRNNVEWNAERNWDATADLAAARASGFEASCVRASNGGGNAKPAQNESEWIERQGGITHNTQDESDAKAENNRRSPQTNNSRSKPPLRRGSEPEPQHAPHGIILTPAEFEGVRYENGQSQQIWPTHMTTHNAQDVDHGAHRETTVESGDGTEHSLGIVQTVNTAQAIDTFQRNRVNVNSDNIERNGSNCHDSEETRAHSRSDMRTARNRGARATKRDRKRVRNLLRKQCDNIMRIWASREGDNGKIGSMVKLSIVAALYDVCCKQADTPFALKAYVAQDQETVKEISQLIDVDDTKTDEAAQIEGFYNVFLTLNHAIDAYNRDIDSSNASAPSVSSSSQAFNEAFIKKVCQMRKQTKTFADIGKRFESWQGDWEQWTKKFAYKQQRRQRRQAKKTEKGQVTQTSEAEATKAPSRVGARQGQQRQGPMSHERETGNVF